MPVKVRIPTPLQSLTVWGCGGYYWGNGSKAVCSYLKGENLNASGQVERFCKAKGSFSQTVSKNEGRFRKTA